MSRWGSWCSKQGHAPRLPAPKPHHHHAQAQARHPAAAAAAVRRAPASVIVARRSRFWGEEGQKRCRAGEQRASGYNMQTAG